MTRSKPQRKCLGCGEMKDKSELIRIVRGENGLFIDPRGKANGRGAYVCRSTGCLEAAIRKRRFEKALGVTPDETLTEKPKCIVRGSQESDRAGENGV